MSELTGVAGKVENLGETVERLESELEASKTRTSALEIKAASSGKLGLSDMLKIGALVISLTTVVQGLVQVYVKSNQAEALRELREQQAMNVGTARALDQRVIATEALLGRRTDWIQEVGGQLANVEARVMGLERQLEVSTQARWTATDHKNFAEALKRELELVWKVLDSVTKEGGE